MIIKKGKNKKEPKIEKQAKKSDTKKEKSKSNSEE